MDDTQYHVVFGDRILRDRIGRPFSFFSKRVGSRSKDLDLSCRRRGIDHGRMSDF